MTAALIVLGVVVLGILWSAWLWHLVRSGGAPGTQPPRHVGSDWAAGDWGTRSFPSTPYSRMPRLP